MSNLNDIVKQLEAERDRIDSAIKALRGVSGNPGGRKRRTLSATARQRIAAAQRARWARVKRQRKSA